MKKRIGLSPDLHRHLEIFPDVTQGGTFDITIRLPHENGGFWAVYEGRSSIITVPTVAMAIQTLAKLRTRYELDINMPTRTFQARMRKLNKEYVCHQQSEPAPQGSMRLKLVSS